MGLARSSRTRTVIIALALIGAALAVGQNLVLASEDSGPSPQQTSTPSGQLALPTATPSPIGGVTGPPARTPTFPVVTVQAENEANVRNGPGLDFDIVGTLTAGDPVRVVGRSINFPWYVVEWPSEQSGVAWVFAELVIVQGDITTVPVYPDPSAPTVDPTQAAIQATATVLLQTPGAAETATATALFAPTGVFTSTPDPAGNPAGAGSPPPPQFTAPAQGNGNAAQPTSIQDPTAGAAIPPAMLIITLGGLGVLALAISVLRR